jgi:UDP-glucose 4-epimerase
MEEALQAALSPEHFLVYRPSSVFGYAHGGRLSLVAAAIIGTLNRRPVKIFGHPATLRDYVYAEDLGQFIADRIASEKPLSGERLILASGKPSTVDEVIRTVSQLMQHPVMLHYDLSPSNALNNSYRPSIRPPGFAVTPQVQAIQKTIQMIAMEHPQGR